MTKAVLIDIKQIQDFIFNSNKLKYNLGASYIISDLFNFEYECVKKIFDGGGNALFLTEKPEEFIKAFSTDCLLKGISISSSISDWNEKNTGECLKELYKKNNENKLTYQNNIFLHSYSITSECRLSGLQADNFIRLDKEQGIYVSSTMKNKIQASDENKKEMTELLKSLLGEEYELSDELEDLGQKKGSENHIAVVHIDGNNMGSKFSNCKSLEELQILSKNVKDTFKDCFIEMVNELINNLKKINDPRFELKSAGKGKYYLPLRPIVLGGDDITFVCNGILGIYLAQKFLEILKTKSDNKYSACAGVAIVKTKYPFYRAYQMAEELCKNAKKEAKNLSEESSWIDFHISMSGESNSIENVRSKSYKMGEKSLLLRPLRVSNYNPPKDNFYTKEKIQFLEPIVNLSKRMQKPDKEKYKCNSWGISRIKEIREALYQSDESVKMVIKQALYNDQYFPKIQKYEFITKMEEIDTLNLFVDNVTPYFDSIELMDFYPEFKEV